MTLLQSKTFPRVWMFIAMSAILISACSDKDDPAPPVEEKSLAEATLTSSRTAAELQFFIQLSGLNVDPSILANDVDVYNVVYKTTYKDDEIEASGLIILPKATAAVPMVSFHHGTIVQQSQAPSVQTTTSAEIISYAALASMGFVTVVPDMIGFGVSKDIFHPYYVEEPTTTAVLDMLDAAVELIEEKEIDFNGKLFLAGYSQGGYTTLATHKALEANPSEDFQLVASFPGAGGYDITSMQDYFFGLDTYKDPYYLAYVGMSYQTYYDDPGLLTTFFNEPYASRIPALFDGINTPAAINGQLTEVISDLVTEDILNDTDSNPAFESLRDKFEENSLVDWKPTTPVFLYHGDADVTVPYQNTEVTYQAFLDNGASTETVHLITLPGRDHNNGVEPYVAEVVRKLQEMK